MRALIDIAIILQVAANKGVVLEEVTYVSQLQHPPIHGRTFLCLASTHKLCPKSFPHDHGLTRSRAQPHLAAERNSRRDLGCIVLGVQSGMLLLSLDFPM